MEEEVQPHTRKRFNSSSSSPAIRFLGFLNQPDSDSNPFELDESDVIWSPDLQDSLNLDAIVDCNSSPRLLSPTLSTTISNSNSPEIHHHHHSFRSEKFGLSAALSDDHKSFIQRNGRPSLNQGLGLSSAAKMIPSLMSNPRSGNGSGGGSSYDDYSGSYKGKFHQSAPVNVPIWHKANNARDNNNNNNNDAAEKLGLFDEEDEETEEEMLPPHEIVARSHTTTFSVFEGVGRTLKGRDLRRVRNAVWQKTGFLD